MFRNHRHARSDVDRRLARPKRSPGAAAFPAGSGALKKAKSFGSTSACDMNDDIDTHHYSASGTRQSPSPVEATRTRLEDSHLRDTSTPPIVAKINSASPPLHNSRKRTAEHGNYLLEPPTFPDPGESQSPGFLPRKDALNQPFPGGPFGRPDAPHTTMLKPDPELEGLSNIPYHYTRGVPPYENNAESQAISVIPGAERPVQPPPPHHHHHQHQRRQLTSAAAMAATASSQANAMMTHTPTPPPANQSGQKYDMQLQPETRPITEVQLVHEVRGIYAGLVMVEKKCMEIDQQQGNSKKELSNEQWQALIALHRTLLHEHHDFFLASQHPSASDQLKDLAGRYAMPARMWRHGIHSFLELLRHRLPQSFDHMLAFIYTTYSMMALLVESVPSFQDTWIECLGDLARYRMAIEDHDIRDREIWASVARYWYHKAADKSPDVGRIQHHLAVLSRPNLIQQLFYYTKSLVCVQPFLNTQDSIMLVFNPIMEPSEPGRELPHPRHLPVMVAFVKVHATQFSRRYPLSSMVQFGDEFMSHLGAHIGRMSLKWRDQGVFIASTNFAAMLGYGSENSILMPFYRRAYGSRHGLSKQASEYWPSAPCPKQSPFPVTSKAAATPVDMDINLEALQYATYFAFNVFSFVLRHIGNRNVVPHVYVSMAFVWSLVLIPEAMAYVEAEIPWLKLVTFLNALRPQFSKPDSNLTGEQFPRSEAGGYCHLPEDFLIRGQTWTYLVYPDGYYDNPSVAEDERFLEPPSIVAPRAERCIWLGHRIASMNRWIRFDEEQGLFTVTEHAIQLEQICNHHNVFTQVAKKRMEGPEQGVKTIDPEGRLTSGLP